MLAAVPFIGTSEKARGEVVKQESIRQNAEGKNTSDRQEFIFEHLRVNGDRQVA